MVAGYYYFKSDEGLENGTNWTNEEYAYDNDIDTYASRTIPTSSGKETTKWVKVSSWDESNFPTDSSNVTINYVRIDVRNVVESVPDVYIYGVPVINGTTDGSEYLFQSRTNKLQTDLIDITNDAVGPGAGNWTFDDIKKLDFKIYTENKSGSVTRYCRIHEIRCVIYFDMDEETTYFDDATCSLDSAAWTDLDNALDGSTSTYAYRDLPESSFPYPIYSDYYIDFNSVDTNLTEDDNVNIYQVHVKLHYSVERDNDVIFHIQPEINGNLYSGSFIATPNNNHPTVETETIDLTYLDIAPDVWTVNDLKNINVRVWAENADDDHERLAYVHKVDLIISYIVNITSLYDVVDEVPVPGYEPEGDSETPNLPRNCSDLFKYTNGSQTTTSQEDWSNLSNIWDGTTATYANTSFINYLDISETITGTTNDVVAGTEDPLEVYVGVKSKMADSTSRISIIYVTVKESGGNIIGNFLFNPTSDNYTHWFKINLSEFSWTDIQGYDVEVYAENRCSNDVTVYIDGIYLAVNASVYGLEVYDSTGLQTIRIVDSLTRNIDTFVASAGNSGTVTYTDLALSIPDLPAAFAVPLDTEGCPHDCVMSQDGDDYVLTYTAKDVNFFFIGSFLDNCDSLITVLGW